ncbi:Uncharacterised protein [Candidatus Bilamarchaeum dharawalense]|uniref:Lipoprotein n=1 Tax=Candidatus Bilamarchaeum dharawalense TaxID=2885759 RepID=A0A5E4LU47_9ARCH|nr:Uncharacterised protein [Candidatus Bilamarchaeum dharawalense]
MKYTLIWFLLITIFFFGCTQLSNLQSFQTVSLGELNTNPHKYLNQTVEIEAEPTDFGFDNVNIAGQKFWRLGDDQGYKILIKPYLETGRTYSAYNTYKIRGVFRLLQLCDCENNLSAITSPTSECRASQNKDSIIFDYNDDNGLTNNITFIAVRGEIIDMSNLGWTPKPSLESIRKNYPVVCDKTFDESSAHYICPIKNPESFDKYVYTCQVFVSRPEYTIVNGIPIEECLNKTTTEEQYSCKTTTDYFYVEGTDPMTVTKTFSDKWKGMN